jgi:hypothetical protein
VAAIIPGFILINSLGILVSLLLPIGRTQAITWATVLAFLAYTVLIMWVFHVKSLRRIWVVLGLWILASVLANAVIILRGSL